MANLRKVRSGDPMRIPAETYNAFIDAANDTRRAGGTSTGRISGSPQSPNVIRIRNDTGEARSRYDVVAIGDPIITASQNENHFAEVVAMKGTTPTIPGDRGQWVILLEPLGAGKIGRALVAGVTACRVKMVDTDHTRCDVEDSSHTLASSTYGRGEILWTAASSDGVTDWAVVRFPVDSPTIISEITGEASGGGGLYSAKRLQFSGSGLTDASTGETWTDTILEVNGREGIHSGTRIEMTFLGVDSSGNEWYRFCDDSADSGTVNDDVAYVHAEHADAADASTWDRDDQATDERGVKVTVQTGTRYDHSATYKLYAYLRDCTFDADGHLVSIGAETRVEIDAAEDCTE